MDDYICDRFAKRFKYGNPVRVSKSGEPVLALFDLTGSRWSMRFLRKLVDGTRTFRELQADCDFASPTVLNTRFKELRTVGLVAKTNLTTSGRQLFEWLEPLGGRAMQWTKTL